MLNGRLRSATPPATLTARLHPAIARLVTITTLASCCHCTSVRRKSLSKSATVAGNRLVSGKAASSIVRDRSIADADPSVATTTDKSESFWTLATSIGAAGHTGGLSEVRRG